MSVLHICKPIFQCLHQALHKHACGAVSSATPDASSHTLSRNQRNLEIYLRREFGATRLEGHYTYEGQDVVDLGVGELDHLFKEKDLVPDAITEAETAYFVVNRHTTGWDQGHLWSSLAEQAILDQQETFIASTPVDAGKHLQGGYEFTRWQYDESGIPIPTKFLGPMEELPEFEACVIEYMLNLKSPRQISIEKGPPAIGVAYKLYAVKARQPYGFINAMGEHASYNERKKQLDAIRANRT